MEELILLKAEINAILNEINIVEWINCNITINFPPTSNEGYRLLIKFFNNNNILNNEASDEFNFNEQVEKILHNLIVKHNQESIYNQIIFNGKRDDLKNASIKILFNQEVEDNFQNNMPKSKRGKTLPWYLNEKYNQLKS